MVRQFANLEELSRAAAEEFCWIARDAVAGRGVCTVALAGGSTPRCLYQLLAAEPYRKRVEWEHIEFFWGDERAVPPDHKDSNFRMANEVFLEKLSIPKIRIHRLEAEGANRDAAAKGYEAEIARVFGVPVGGEPPAFDLALLGMGADGHTASLFPNTKALDETGHWVVAHQVPKLASDRVTMTPRILNAARRVLFLVAGADKADALARVLEGSREPRRLPAQLIQPTSGLVTWFVDRAAAAKLSPADGAERQIP